MAKHTVQEKSEFYVLCLKRANSGEFNYWEAVHRTDRI